MTKDLRHTLRLNVGRRDDKIANQNHLTKLTLSEDLVRQIFPPFPSKLRTEFILINFAAQAIILDRYNKIKR